MYTWPRVVLQAKVAGRVSKTLREEKRIGTNGVAEEKDEKKEEEEAGLKVLGRRSLPASVRVRVVNFRSLFSALPQERALYYRMKQKKVRGAVSEVVEDAVPGEFSKTKGVWWSGG